MNPEAERLRNPRHGKDHQRCPRGERKLVPGRHRSRSAVIRLQKPVGRSREQTIDLRDESSHTLYKHSRSMILLYSALLLIIFMNMKNTTQIKRHYSWGALEAGREIKCRLSGVLGDNTWKKMLHFLTISCLSCIFSIWLWSIQITCCTKNNPNNRDSFVKWNPVCQVRDHRLF